MKRQSRPRCSDPIEPVGCGVPADLWSQIPEGTVFTIAGVKLTAHGWIRDCQPGEETCLISREEKRK